MARAGTQEPSHVELRPLGDGRFALAGRIGFDNAARLLAEGDTALDGVSAAEIDLSGVTQADSAALAVLLEWVAGARRRGRTLRYVSMPRTVAAFARISEVESLLRCAEASPSGDAREG